LSRKDKRRLISVILQPSVAMNNYSRVSFSRDELHTLKKEKRVVARVQVLDLAQKLHPTRQKQSRKK
jgi:hypothetical protein